MTLNHYAINSIIRGKMVKGGRAVRFGPSGVMGAAATMLKHRPRPDARFDFDHDTDKKLFDAFVQVHNGASAETIMIDKALASRFHAAARKKGVHASAAALNRRLLNFRKNPGRFRAHGIVLPEAT